MSSNYDLYREEYDKLAIVEQGDASIVEFNRKAGIAKKTIFG